MNNRNDISMVIEFHITDSIFFPEGFPAIFKIPDIVSMPDDAQRVCFIESYKNLLPDAKFCMHSNSINSQPGQALIAIFGFPFIVFGLLNQLDCISDRTGPIVSPAISVKIFTRVGRARRMREWTASSNLGFNPVCE